MNTEPKRQTETQPANSNEASDIRLVDAKHSIRQKLLRAAVKQALSEIGDSDSIAEKAVAMLGPELERLAEAASSVRELIVQKVADDALKSLTEGDRLGREIAEGVSLDQTHVRAVVNALRIRLSKSIQQVTLASLADANRTAAEIARHIPTDGTEIHAAVTTVRDRLISEARNDLIRKFQNADEIVDEVRAALSDDNESLQNIRRLLVYTLVHDACQYVLSQLLDTKEVTAQIRADLGDLPEFVLRIGTELQAILTAEAKQRSVEALADSERIAGEVLSLLGENPAVVMNAVETVRSHLVSAIVQEVNAQLDNAEETAREAYRKLDFSQHREATSRMLTKLLLQEIASRSAVSISDPVVAADAAYALFDRDGKEPEDVKHLLEIRILREMLVQAIGEIESEAGEIATHIDSEARQTSTGGLSDEEIAQVVSHIFLKASAQSTLQQSKALFSSGIASVHDDVGQDQNAVGDQKVSDDENSSLPKAAEPGALSNREGGTPNAGETVVSAWDLESREQQDPEVEDSARYGARAGVFAKEDNQQTTSLFWQSLESLSGYKSAREARGTINPSIEPVRQQSETSTPIHYHDGACEDDNSEWMPESETVSGKDSSERAGQDYVYYLYGITTSSADGPSGRVPLGIQSGRVDAVEYNGLSAIVGMVPADGFSGPKLKSNLSNAGWLQENVRKHAEIIDQLRSRQTLLPMPFCTVLPSHNSILSMLQSNSDSYRDAIQRVSGKQEWGLRIYCNRPILGGLIYEGDRNLKRALSGQSQEVLGYLREVTERTGPEARVDPLELVTDHCTQRTHEALVSISAEARTNPNSNGQLRPGEDMVLNAAYLVEDNSDSEIRTEVDRLRAEYTELGFRFDLTGPLPPYHFVNGMHSRRQAV